MVTPDLRAVELWVSEGSVRAEFAYDDAVSGEHRELVAEIETEVIADLRSHPRRLRGGRITSAARHGR